MNNENRSQIPGDLDTVAKELASIAENLVVAAGFQSSLESQLVEAHRVKIPAKPMWTAKILPSLAWAAIVFFALIFLNWAVRSLIPTDQPGTERGADPDILSGAVVPKDETCRGQLAAAHGFSVFLTDVNNPGFVDLDGEKQIGELRYLAWSPDESKLAIVGNTRGNGNLYLWNPDINHLEPVISNSEFGYLMGTAWSHDGAQLVTWEIDNRSALQLIAISGAEQAKIDLPMQFFETPQFAPDDESILFFGADSSSSGLFQVMLGNLQVTMISPLVEEEGNFAWSRDGSRLAYFEMDRSLGEARLVVDDRGSNSVIASLPIPTGSGSSIPNSANLSWSPDGKFLVFDFGRYVSDRSVYLAYADGTGLAKIVGPAHAPAVSENGKCLAYINDEQVFLVEFASDKPGPDTTSPELLAELPTSRGRADIRLDKLQWLSETPSP